MSHEHFDPKGAYGASEFSNRELTEEEMKEIFRPYVEAQFPPEYRDKVGYKCTETTCASPPAKYVLFCNYNGKEPVL